LKKTNKDENPKTTFLENQENIINSGLNNESEKNDINEKGNKVFRI